MKKADKYNLLRHIKIVILTGMLLLLISCTAYFISLRTLGLINLTGLIDDRNRFLIYLAILFICFILAGALVDSLIRHIITKKQKNLIDAMKRVADGELTTRLENGKKLTDTGYLTVNTFNDMARMLQESNVMNRDFAGNLTHEIKAPIGNINGFAKVIKNTMLSEEEKNEYLDIIIEESERLRSLSDNILLLSGPTRHEKAESMEEYNLTEQLRQVIASLYLQLEAKKLQVIFQGEEIDFCGSIDMMSQVWINLLDNAIRFSPEGESLTLSTKKIDDTLYVSISNYGCSLNEEELYNIFDRFYTKSSSIAQKGNGLGLSIAKKIISMHKGDITAQKGENSLFTITVTLPAEK